MVRELVLLSYRSIAGRNLTNSEVSFDLFTIASVMMVTVKLYADITCYDIFLSYIRSALLCIRNSKITQVDK